MSFFFTSFWTTAYYCEVVSDRERLGIMLKNETKIHRPFKHDYIHLFLVKRRVRSGRPNYAFDGDWGPRCGNVIERILP